MPPFAFLLLPSELRCMRALGEKEDEAEFHLRPHFSISIHKLILRFRTDLGQGIRNFQVAIQLSGVVFDS